MPVRPHALSEGAQGSPKRDDGWDHGSGRVAWRYLRPWYTTARCISLLNDTDMVCKNGGTDDRHIEWPCRLTEYQQ